MTPSRRKGKRFERDVEMAKKLMMAAELADVAQQSAKRKGGGK